MLHASPRFKFVLTHKEIDRMKTIPLTGHHGEILRQNAIFQFCYPHYYFILTSVLLFLQFLSKIWIVLIYENCILFLILLYADILYYKDYIENEKDNEYMNTEEQRMVALKLEINPNIYISVYLSFCVVNLISW